MSSALTHKSSSNARVSRILPRPVRATLDAARSLLSRFVLCQAVVQWSVAMLVGYWLFGLVDYLPASLGSAESPTWVRVAMLGLLLIGTCYILYEQIWKRWLVRWSDDAIALLIERKYPDFESSLITTVQSSNPSTSRGGVEEHPTRSGFLALAESKALEILPKVEVAQLVRSQQLQLQLVALGGAVAVSILLAMLYPEWTQHWNKRLFSLSDSPWPRAVELGVEGIEYEVPSFTGSAASQRYLLTFADDRIDVPAGQSGVLKAFASLDAKAVPELCTVYYRDEEGVRGRANMRRLSATQSKQPFLLDGPPLESLSQSLWLSLAGGDARISNLHLQAVQAPMISELKIRVVYPEYLQRSTQSRWGEEILPYKTGLRIPRGSQITLLIQASKQVDRCEFLSIRSDQTASETEGQSVHLTQPSNALEIPIGELDTNLLLEFRLWDTSGICSSRVQQFVLATILDEAPKVDMVLDGIGTSVTENVSIPVVGKVEDDYDVRDVWLEVVAGEGSTVRFDMEGDVASELRSTLDFREQKDAGRVPITTGSTIAITVAADDYFDLRSEPQVGKSPTVQLAVVTPDQLLLLLDRREAAMRKRLEQIIGEVSQLRTLLANIERRNAGEQVDPQPTTADDQPIPETPEERSERLLRIQLLRSQQAISQISKSGSELSGVEKEIAQIAKELINNRIDSVDRRTRWQEKIQLPLRTLLDNEWVELSRNTQDLEKLFAKGASAPAPASTPVPGDGAGDGDALGEVGPLIVDAIKQNDGVLIKLHSILADMLEIQDQTAIIDMLREIIDNSNALIEETKEYKKEQDRNALDFLQ